MKYLPFENITYQTKLDSKEILNRINKIIEPKKTFRMTGFWRSSDHKPYEGSVNKSSFKMIRIIDYKNSFLPRIKGNVENSFGKTKINVKMSLHPFIIGFTFLWCVGVGVGFLVLLISCIEKQTFEPAILVPLGMLLFGYGLTTLGFKYESTKSKKYLAELFEARIEKNN